MVDFRRKELFQNIHTFFKDPDFLSKEGDFILQGDRLVVKKGCKEEVMQELHLPHSGNNGCIRRTHEL